MKRTGFVIVAALLGLLLAGEASAFTLAVDVPTRFTFDEKYITKSKSVKFVDTNADSMSGFKVLITGNTLIGIGYERYEVTATASAGGEFDFTNTFQFYDVFLDLPTKVLNFTLGYGMGTVNTVFKDSPGVHTQGADARQWFASIGYPFGQGFDVHLAYHLVTMDDQEVSSPPDDEKANFSGSAYMAGVRLAW